MSLSALTLGSQFSLTSAAALFMRFICCREKPPTNATNKANTAKPKLARVAIFIVLKNMADILEI
jgi:hypothetical protein